MADTENMELTLGTSEGNEVVVSVTYPKDNALLALRALDTLAKPEYISGLIAEFSDDPSVAEMLKRAGLVYGDEDDDDDYYYADEDED